MTYPVKFPQKTNFYNHYWKYFKSDEILRHVCSVDWDITTYEGAGDPKNIAKLNLLPNFKITDPRLSWFTCFTEEKYLDKLNELTAELIANNNLDICISDVGFAMIVLVPGAHLQEHIDQGQYAGTTLIMPILGSGVFTYGNGAKKFTIDSPTFASNTVWHNYINTSKSLHIFFTLALPLAIHNLNEKDLIEADDIQ